MDMNNDAQDIGKQSASQMGRMGKKAGGRLTSKAFSKLNKFLKKLLASFIQKVIIGTLKAIIAYIGPVALMILIAALMFLAVLDSIPFADWFLKGGTRTDTEVRQDQEYELEFKNLANESVAEIDEIKANQQWKDNFKNLVKPSWGIPAALTKYQIVKADQKIELPDPEDMFKELEPEFLYKTVSTDREYFKYVKTCEHTTETDTWYTTDTSYRDKLLPSHEVLDKVITPYGETTIPSLKRYYPGGHTDGFHSWDYIGSSRSDNCRTKKYRRWEDTQVDDRGLPMLNIDPGKLKNIIMSKGVPEIDVPVIFEFASLADEYFYAEQFDGSVGKGSFTNATYEYDGKVIEGWVWPVANNRTITSSFGPRWGTFHYGVDLGGRVADGFPILAAKDGLVILSQWSDSYGNWVIIAHDDGLQTRYAHMKKLTVKANQQVVAGDQIGILGTTGDSTGPHLHFEVLRPGATSPFARSSQMEKAYDPMIFLSRILEEEG